VSQTSDEMEAEAEMLARLGDAEQADALRREKAEAALSSDMAAFKAANPGAIIEDFVRWHSPKDWRRRKDEDEDSRHRPLTPTTSATAAVTQALNLSADSEVKATASKGPGMSRRDPRRGELSMRMRHQNNRWQRLWKVTPAHGPPLPLLPPATAAAPLPSLWTHLMSALMVVCRCPRRLLPRWLPSIRCRCSTPPVWVSAC
jgi:hypothetical protein